MTSALRRLLWLAVLAVAGCRARDSPEVARVRKQRDLLQGQLAGLNLMLGKAERGELVNVNQIAIGLDDKVVMELVAATLPQEHHVAGFGIRVEAGTAYFRAGQTLFVFQTTLWSESAPNSPAKIELGGQLVGLHIEKGRLSGRIALAHFAVLEAPGGNLAKNVLEDLARDNPNLFEEALPPIEIPVSLEQEIAIAGLQEGPVRARAGRLPLRMAVSQVVPVSGRLWILIDAAAGPWQAETKAP